MALRIAAVILIFISACAFPVWVTIVLGAACFAYFKNFYEIVPLFLVNDAVYGISGARFFGFPFIMTLIAVIGVALSMLARNYFFDAAFSRKI